MEIIKRNIILISIVVLAGMVLLLNILQSVERELYGTGECHNFQTWRLKRNGVQPIDYGLIAEIPNAQDQIQAVIKEASSWHCLPYGHWFRVGFDPFHKDIVLRDDILAPYKEKKETMWIYIQYAYNDLKATPLGIDVIVYFNGKPEQILIPYESITWFDDPAYNFLLQPWADGKEKQLK